MTWASRAILLLRRLGMPGLAGLTLLAIAAWVHFRWLPVQQVQVDALASHARHLRHELQEANGGPLAPKDKQAARPWDLSGMTPEAAWQTVWEALPDDARRLAFLSSITASAQKMGVSVASVQYRGAVEPWSAHQGQALWRQRMAMPVEGRYGDVRAWLGTLLHQSYLSLDTLEITRSDTTTDHVKARVSVSLWWRTSVGHTP